MSQQDVYLVEELKKNKIEGEALPSFKLVAASGAGGWRLGSGTESWALLAGAEIRVCPLPPAQDRDAGEATLGA